MNPQVLELLSAYLDGEINQEQKATVEYWLEHDAAVRHELEQLRSFCGAIEQSKPADIAVPPSFRPAILEKIKRIKPMGASNRGGFFRPYGMNYLLAGTILAGLVTFLAVHDIQNQQKINQAARWVDDLKIPEKAREGPMPEYTGRYAEVQDRSDKQPIEPKGTSPARLLKGRIYHGSRHGHSAQASSARPADSHAGRFDHISSEDPFSGHLESTRDWSEALIQAKISGHKFTSGLDGAAIFKLAHQNNLNPGLIISLAQLNPGKDIDQMVQQVREILNQSSRQTNSQRLNLIIKAFNGDKDWESVIQSNLRP